jgi:parallel beta-helix repeat protein
MPNRIIAICILFLLLALFRLNFEHVNGSDGLVIRVPGDYPRIGWAVGNATNGDTILVAPGTYQENVIVNKSLRIVGEARNTTVVDGGGYDWQRITTCFLVLSANVSIENLTIQDAYYGIYVEDAENATIQSNIVVLSLYGIFLEGSHYATIQDNLATNNSYGVLLHYCTNCTVNNNTATDNYGGDPDLRIGAGIHLGKSNNTMIADNYLTRNIAGIVLESSSDNTIMKNIAVDNREPVYNVGWGINVMSSDGNTIVNNTIVSGGIVVTSSCFNVVKDNLVLNGGGIGAGQDSRYNLFFRNVISGNEEGIHIESAQEFFIGNLIKDNTIGIAIHYSNSSTFYHNILINNTEHAQKDVYTNVNIWDNGHEGNYWSNYTGLDSDQDGIGDTPHELYELNEDRYPLIAPISIFDAGTWNDTEQQINVISNSTITDFQLNTPQAKISFNATGDTPSIGFCRLTIPNIIVQNLWNDNYTILIDNKEPIYTKNWTDTTNTYIYITYQHSQHEIVIIPESPLNTLLTLLTLSTLFIIFSKKRLKH